MLASLFFNSLGHSVNQGALDFQKELNVQYIKADRAPLSEGLSFFPIDNNYKVKAKFKLREIPKGSGLDKSSTPQSYDVIYGELRIIFTDKSDKLNVYQSHTLKGNKEFREALFLPFTNLTSGNECYAEELFINLEIHKGNTKIIDFNQAFNPCCAYNYIYSCPVPLQGNFLDLKIEAGVKAPVWD
ncbi:MAG: hypothetical protein ACI8P7_000304 [Candidatus Azotimanducaceae bacterium]